MRRADFYREARHDLTGPLADVRVVELDEPCRRQQVNDGCFPRLEEARAPRSRSPCPCC